MLQEPRLNVIDVTLNDNLRCPVTAASPLMAYGLGVGAVGSAVHGTDTFALNATGGSVTFVGACDSSGEFCNFSQLKDLKVTLSDVVVSGTTVQNLEGRLTKPAPIVVTGGVRKIAKANFRFDISGTFLDRQPASPSTPPATSSSTPIRRRPASRSRRPSAARRQVSTAFRLRSPRTSRRAPAIRARAAAACPPFSGSWDSKTSTGRRRRSFSRSRPPCTRRVATV